MNNVDILFLAVILVPLLTARWRMSLIALGLQGLLLFEAAGGSEPSLDTGYALDAIDLLVVRGLLAPALLYYAFQRPGVPARNDVIPPNLFAWTGVVLLVLVSFNFADGAADGSARVGVAATALVLGFVVLATQSSVFSQIVGALRIENAIALFELTVPDLHPTPSVRLVHAVVAAITIGFFAWFMAALAALPVERPTDATPTGAP